jgi:hypothetical protein
MRYTFALEDFVMLKRAMIAAVVSVFVSAPAAAQRIEVSGLFGWTISDGVDGQNVPAPDGRIYNRADPKDSAGWGFSVGGLITDQFEAGFLFHQQMSKLVVKGTTETELGDMSVNTYHGYFGLNFGEADSKARPYVLFGLGATNYGQVDFTALGEARSTSGETQFSTTMGAGIKYFMSPRFGIRAGMHWTPTYIKSDPGGWWCGCYLVGDAQYSNQLHFVGGVTARF